MFFKIALLVAKDCRRTLPNAVVFFSQRYWCLFLQRRNDNLRKHYIKPVYRHDEIFSKPNLNDHEDFQGNINWVLTSELTMQDPQ